MSGAPFAVDLTFAAGATVQFTGDFALSDGAPWPVADYEHEWVMWTDTGNRIFSGTPENGGIIVATAEDNAEAGLITFDMGGQQPAPGQYSHAYRMTHAETGERIVVFDGRISIEGRGF